MSYLIYDGDCPFCARYVEFLDLKKHFPDLELLNAREFPDHEAVRLVRSSGKLLDEGMALVDGNHFIHGAEVIQSLSNGNMHGIFFRSNASAERNYRILRWGRNMMLKLLGRKKLGF